MFKSLTLHGISILLLNGSILLLSLSYNVSSCIAALLGGQVILTDLPDRLRLLKKNVEANLYGDVRGSATVDELTWGDELDHDIKDPLPDYGNNLRWSHSL